jgi:CheY-like chemotaxis protein
MVDSKSPERSSEQRRNKWFGTMWVWLIGVTGALIFFVLVIGIIVDWYIDPEDPEMKRDLVKALVFDAPMRLLERVAVWPVILLITLFLFRRPIGEFVHSHLPDLISRLRTAKVPGGFEFDFSDAAEVFRHVVDEGAAAHGDNMEKLTEYVKEQSKKLPLIAATSPADPSDLRGRLLLWVDDHPANNVVETDICERLGATISFAKSTEEARKEAHQKRYDVVISDMGRLEDGIYNDKAGYDLLDILQSELNIMPPLIIYAGTNAPPPAEAKQRGAFGSTDDPQVLLQLIINAAKRQ